MTARLSIAQLKALQAKPRKRSKYNARKVEIDEYVFDSRAEADHYLGLRALQSAKKIRGLVVHPRFPIIINDKQVCIVELDFGYVENNTMIYEDVKGFFTPMSRLKHKLLAAAHPTVNVRIVRAK